MLQLVDAFLELFDKLDRIQGVGSNRYRWEYNDICVLGVQGRRNWLHTEDHAYQQRLVGFRLSAFNSNCLSYMKMRPPAPCCASLQISTSQNLHVGINNSRIVHNVHRHYA